MLLKLILNNLITSQVEYYYITITITIIKDKKNELKLKYIISQWEFYLKMSQFIYSFFIINTNNLDFSLCKCFSHLQITKKYLHFSYYFFLFFSTQKIYILQLARFLSYFINLWSVFLNYFVWNLFILHCLNLISMKRKCIHKVTQCYFSLNITCQNWKLIRSYCLCY